MHIGSHHIPAKQVHMACQTTVSLSFLTTIFCHGIEGYAEPIAACVSSILAVWVCDIERRLRHPRL